MSAGVQELSGGMMEAGGYIWPVGQLVLGALCLAVSWALVKKAMHETSIPQMLFYRSFGGLSLAMVIVLAGGLQMPTGAQWPWVGLTILLAPTLIGVLAFTGMRSGSMAAINALTLTQPLFVLMIDTAFLARGHPAIGWVGGALVVLGCVVISRDGRQIGTRGMVLGLASSLVWATAAIVQMHVLKDLAFPKLSLIAWQNMGYFVFAATMLMISGAQGRERGFAGWKIVGLAVVSGLLVQILFEYLKFSALPVVGPFVTTSVLLLQLPFSILLGWVALKEKPNLHMGVAAACIMVGAVLASMPA